jgi:hypothetical protein
MINLTDTLTKNLAASFVAGNNVGGLDTGAITNNTYHVFAIANSSTGNGDFCFSLSNSSPTLPAGFDVSRRIGSVIRSGAAILPFWHFDDHFKLKTDVVDVSSITSRSNFLQGFTVPNGIRVRPLLTISAREFNTGTVIPHISLGDGDGTVATTEVNSIRVDNNGDVAVNSVDFFWTNTSKQLRYSFGFEAGSTLEAYSITTSGWIDTRGRLGP